MKTGDVLKGRYIGKAKSHDYMWTSCPICGEERWVKLYKGNLTSSRCNKCRGKEERGENSHNWKGGKTHYTGGYIMVLVLPDSQFASMRRNNGYVPEHRLVMAKYLERPLLKWEQVHHINEDKLDNRIENLMIVTKEQHKNLIYYLATLWLEEHSDIAGKISRNFVKGEKE